ncbi:MAG: TonB-dependent receptor [Gammaproteobacteria bacterium]|nr:TonB-dependent receptor [Gammaproteobacteria bacterium]MYA67638.1 TonB-dependent receptor [Gammaproteobacteria bacterium]MYG97439.1 TonB-dependent receptor [Gammaproteobacteria bacterium]MYH46448.1 TonB-dependent receptor [Gammaproteobacteria bacterium]MYL13380.1 TonB-dependent receptor [Gammaproteobacteria bacterium]
MKHPASNIGALVGASILTFTAGAPLAAFAQDDDGPRQIEEVIVTAERREASIQDTSISITAFTAETLEDFGIRNQEDLQNFIPATTIQPYDSTIRGVGRNFRALGGDPGVATYMNGIYSEDLLTATAATFWDVERIEILRGPQGTLYGRNAVGGAINVLYNPPADEVDYSFKSILGNFGTNEWYGMFNTPLVDDTLSARVNFSLRDRDGIVKDIGTGGDIDSLGTENVAGQFRWTPRDDVEVNLRQNFMEIDRSFGGSNGGGLVVLNEEGNPNRNTTSLVPGYRFIDPDNTDMANYDSNDWYDRSQPILTFTHPVTGVVGQAQPNRAGIDPGGFNGYLNAAASLDGFNFTSPATAARYNACVFPGEIDGGDLCAATNGLNSEVFEQQGTQLSATWTVSDRLELRYLYGLNELTYKRTTDDDNTGSMFHDRQFYVNHEADYSSHEIQAFYDVSDTVSITSGYFVYDATIDQRGDYYTSIGQARMIDPYEDNTALHPAAAAAIGAPGLAGINASTLAFAGRPMVDLYSARESCEVASPAESCQRNNGGNNLQTSAWYGDDNTNPNLNVTNGPGTRGSDLLYHTQTQREAFAAYTQGVWDINETFSLTLGVRYAEDQVTAEENLWRYSETGATSFLALYGGLAAVNRVNGGLVDDGNGNLIVPTEKVTNGGIPFALSVYRPFKRTDRRTTGRVNLDWNVTDNALVYFSATSGYRSGGYNLVFFSNTPTYDPEELTAYEIGYKTRLLNNTMQLNGSFYLYDYDNIHTVGVEVTTIGGTSTSVLEAPGARVFGIEAEGTWLVNDNLTLGGSFSYTPSEYSDTLLISDSSNHRVPGSLYPEFESLTQDIKGNQLLQVPEGKATLWGGYMIPLAGGSQFDLYGIYSWTDDVYFSPFQSEDEKAEAFGRADLRATWTSSNGNWLVTGFVNNIFDEVANLQVLRQGEAEFFRHNAGTTVPRLYGMEFTYTY